jgi:thiosulfate/3-mercaptopyruvate sulfurtransferase
VEETIRKPNPRTFHPKINTEMIASLESLENDHDSSLLLVDSRAPERYHGEIEPIDAVGGHIPGALNLYCMENLDRAQTFLPKEKLLERFSELLRESPPEEIVFYCGSGVTATHNILAMYHAGLGMGKLYPGSWSEWITDPNRPIETQ